MNQKEFDRKIKEYSKKIDEIMKTQVTPLVVEKNILIENFKKECTHPKSKLVSRQINHENEFGNFVDDWTEIEYKCTKCQKVVIVKKKNNPVKSIKILRDILNGKV